VIHTGRHEPVALLGRSTEGTVKESTKKLKGDDTALVMIEIPKGSRNKYEYDEKEKRIRFDRMLFSAVHYPSD
jgi:inorganic pyrophosphatase